MPWLVKFLARHALVGIAIAAVFVGALCWFDVARLGTLVRTHEDGLLAVILLTFGLGVTFGSVQMGFAVMLMGKDDEPPRGRRIRLERLVPRPVKVAARR